MILKAKALLAGLSTYVPGYNYMRPTGGTGSARYCYSVWLRHLVLAHGSGKLAGPPKIVAELGPGDSIGIGLAALISGAETYHALDIVSYVELSKNLEVFDELIRLFAVREPIPGDAEFPLLQPKLENYEFPSELLNNEHLTVALHPERLDSIRSSVVRVGGAQTRIFYHAPWRNPAVIQNSSADMIYSQAVLEHVDDPSGAYRDMRQWLKPQGVMSHQIDFGCHGKADVWNGHWTYSDFAWKIVVGRRPYLLNRVPNSEHMHFLRENGFEIEIAKPMHKPSSLRRSQLARRFRNLPDSDLTTRGLYVLASAPGS